MTQRRKFLSLTLLTIAAACATAGGATAQDKGVLKTQPPPKPETINKPPAVRTSPGAEAKGVVSTQTQLKIDPKTDLKNARNPLQPATLQQSVATYEGIRSGGAATSVPLTGAAGLSSFHLSVDNSDRTINTIAMAKRPDGRADMYLTGAGANDRFNAYGSWHIIPGGVGGEVSTTIRSGETFQLRVPAPPEGPMYWLALGGFRISHGATSAGVSPGDPRIEQLSIKTPDHFSQAVVFEYTRLFIEGSVRTNNATRPINVMVQYVWIPHSSSAGITSAKNDSPPDRSDGGVRLKNLAFGSLPRSNKYVISGFEFKYLNGPQNLLSLGIHLDDGPLPNHTAGDAVTFQDSDRRDRISWRVDTIEVE